MAILIRAASPTWKLIIISASILGGILLAGGIALAIRGASAQTTMKLFGNEFSSTSVGVAMAFIGAVIATLSIRQVLSSMNKITSGGGGEGPSSGDKSA